MIDIDAISGRDPFDPPPTGYDELARQAGELARRAYGDNAPDAFAAAERTLYAIHTQTEFHAPQEARAHLVWSQLAAGKLKALRDAQPPPRPLGPAALRDAFHALLAERGTGQHPLLEEMRTHGPNGRALRVWAKNWFATSHGFTRQLTGVALRGHRDDQPALAHALAEEFEGTRHYDLRKQFLDHLAIDTAGGVALADPDYLPEALALSSFRCCVSSWRPADYAIGAYLSIEGNWSIEAGRLVEVLGACGLTGKPVEVFVVHSQLDVGHADEWLEIANAPHHTDEDRGRVLLGAQMQLAVRWRMYDAILRRAAASPEETKR